MAAKSQLHIVMFPWLAFGHILPYLHLSKLIAQKGHKITLISTPRNILRLPKLPPNLSSSITFLQIPLPNLPGLPQHAEATIDVNPAQLVHLERAFDAMEPALTRFLEDARPHWIIYDFAPCWLPPIAARLGISRAFFSIINAWFVAFLGPADAMINASDGRSEPLDFTVPPKWVEFETNVAYRHFDAKFMAEMRRRNDSGYSAFYRAGKVISESEAIFVRHCHEFEPKWLTLLEELHHHLRVVPLGLMPPTITLQDDDDDDDITWLSITNWLGGQAKNSVVYVALGTEATLSQDQLTELAHGLDLSGVPFFWVLRQPPGSSNDCELPCGFENRVRGRGIVWKSWAPQVKILSHESVGGFLTHCGWSSIVEGLACGVPLMTLPFVVDQGLNSRVVVGNELGVEIPRDEFDGSYTRNSVADSVKFVMLGDDGRRFRERGEEMRATFGHAELHSEYIDKLVDFLQDFNLSTKHQVIN